MRAQTIRRVLAVILGLNLIVALAKWLAGAAGDVLSLQADALHSGFDAVSNVVGLVSVTLAAHPPDEEHPYGHRKFEPIGAAVIGIVLALTAWHVLGESFERFTKGGGPTVGWVQGVVAAGTMVVNIGIAAYERRAAKRLQSELLAADSAHTASDVLATLAVMGAMAAARFGAPAVDAIVSAGIAVMIAGLGVRVLLTSSRLLVDRAVLDPAEVARVACEVEGVLDCHAVRTRGTPDAVFADLRIHLAAELTLHRAHDISHAVEERLRARYPNLRDVVVHPEPATDEHA